MFYYWRKVCIFLFFATLAHAGAPFGWVGSTTPSVPTNQNFQTNGWAVDLEDGAPVTSVKMYIDGVYVGNATLGGYRPDVASALGRPDLAYSGWDFSYNVGGLSVGTHTFEARALDSASEEGVLSINPSIATFSVSTNTPPITNSVTAGTAIVGLPVTFTGRATDANGNLVTLDFYVSGPGLPSWNYATTASISGADATASGTWTPVVPGDYAVHIRAIDGSGAWDSNANVMATFRVYGNTPPQTVSITVGNGVVGQPLNISATATDADGNLSKLDFYITGPNLPSWNLAASANISGASATGSVVWTPTQAGGYWVHIRASDTGGNPDSNANVASSFSVTVPPASLDWDPRYIKGIHEPLKIESNAPNAYTLALNSTVDSGTKHALLGIHLGQLFNSQSPPSPITFYFEGHQYQVNGLLVAELDQAIRDFTVNGMKVTAVLLTEMTTGIRELSHENAVPPSAEGQPPHFSAFRTTPTADGHHYYRAGCYFLFNRYSNESDPGFYGLVSGWVIGNEIQYHWHWYNMGANNLSLDYVAGEYFKALKQAWELINSINSRVRIYASFTYHWTEEGNLNISGRNVLDKFVDLANSQGNFPWHVAWHPYSSSASGLEPWNDTGTTLTYGSPKVTMKNIEVLSSYLDRPELRFNGQPRRIILSEQGVATGPAPQGESVQAAAYAYYYLRALKSGRIDAIHWISHADAPAPSSWTLGLRRWDFSIKPSYQAYSSADNMLWSSVFDQLGVKTTIGISDYNQLNPQPVTP